jgi:hypothetical protein
MEEPEELYQSDFWGEQPELPEHFAPVQFGCRRQWEAIQQAIISEDEKPKPSAFEVDMLEGFI